MGRRAEEILEFDRLRDLLRARTTSPAGRRAVEALAFRTERRELEREFSAIAEALAYLCSGEELGFGGLADPQAWMERLGMPGAVLAPAELLDAASLIDAATSLREIFRDSTAKFPLLTERARALADLRFLAAAIRRAILPKGEISDDASAALRHVRE
jgi:DNA mismatch repair protein MutS2